MGVLGALVSSELKQGLKWYRFRTFGQIQMQKVTWKFSIMRMECSRTESTLENALGLPTYYVTLQQRPSSGRGLNCISRSHAKQAFQKTQVSQCVSSCSWRRFLLRGGGEAPWAVRAGGVAMLMHTPLSFISTVIMIHFCCLWASPVWPGFGWFHDWGTSQSELNQPMDLSSMDSPFGNQTSLPWQWNVLSYISCWRWF